MSENNKIKVVKRINLPETNSSSSHSIVIDTSDINYTSPTGGEGFWNLSLDNEGYIHIPRPELSKDFMALDKFNKGEGSVFNDVLSKVQYAAGLILTTTHIYTYSDSTMKSKLAMLRDVIVDFTGCKDVIFDWIPEVYNEIVDLINNGTPDGPPPLIRYFYDDLVLSFSSWIRTDNNEELTEEVLESEETLKNFLFNINSYVLTGDVGLEERKEFMTRNSDKPKGVISIHIPDGIGRIDLLFNNHYDPLDNIFEKNNLNYDTIDSIVMDNGVSRLITPGEPLSDERHRIHVSSVDRIYQWLEEGYLIWGPPTIMKSSSNYRVILEHVKKSPEKFIKVPIKIKYFDYPEIEEEESKC